MRPTMAASLPARSMGQNWVEDAAAAWPRRCSMTSMFRRWNGKLMGGGAQDNGSLIGGVNGKCRRVPARAGWRRRVDGLRPGGRDSRFRIEIGHSHFPPQPADKHWSSGFSGRRSVQRSEGERASPGRDRGAWLSTPRTARRCGPARNGCGGRPRMMAASGMCVLRCSTTRQSPRLKFRLQRRGQVLVGTKTRRNLSQSG